MRACFWSLFYPKAETYVRAGPSELEGGCPPPPLHIFAEKAKPSPFKGLILGSPSPQIF